MISYLVYIIILLILFFVIIIALRALLRGIKAKKNQNKKKDISRNKL